MLVLFFAARSFERPASTWLSYPHRLTILVLYSRFRGHVCLLLELVMDYRTHYSGWNDPCLAIYRDLPFYALLLAEVATRPCYTRAASQDGLVYFRWC